MRSLSVRPSVSIYIYIYYTGSKPLQLDTTFYTLGENPFGHKLLWGVCPDRHSVRVSRLPTNGSIKNHVTRVDSVEKIPYTLLQFRHGPNFYHNTSTDCRRPFNNGTQHDFCDCRTSRFSLHHYGVTPWPRTNMNTRYFSCKYFPWHLINTFFAMI